MSGGVDSSVAAYRLALAGFEVVGVTLRLIDIEPGKENERDRNRCPEKAAENARKTAARIGIPHYMLDLSELFREKVMGPAMDEYARGRTPNPCALCNRFMKFEALLEYADELECTLIATGHYARIVEDKSGIHLLRGVDKEKDQSYFLAFLNESMLNRVIFPLGWKTKEDVRETAAEAGLDAVDREESQDLCFFALGVDRPALESGKVSSEPGDIVTRDGEVIGRHDGIRQYTIGQRKGVPGGMEERTYVVGIDADANRVIVGGEEDLYSSEFSVEDISVIKPGRDESRLKKVEVQVRYRTPPVSGSVNLREGGTGTVRLEREVRAITPGQVAAFYAGDEVIGAGTIRSAP